MIDLPNGNEPLSVDTKTHRIKKPVASDVGYDLDFTGVIVVGLGIEGVDTSQFANLGLPNVFHRETTFSGVRLGIIQIRSTNYTVAPTDSVVLIDCTGGDRVVTLPFATGTGQLLRIRKLDTTTDN